MEKESRNFVWEIYQLIWNLFISNHEGIIVGIIRVSCYLLFFFFFFEEFVCCYLHCSYHLTGQSRNHFADLIIFLAQLTCDDADLYACLCILFFFLMFAVLYNLTGRCSYNCFFCSCRGEIPFCSQECRYQHVLNDKHQDSCLLEALKLFDEAPPPVLSAGITAASQI